MRERLGNGPGRGRPAAVDGLGGEAERVLVAGQEAGDELASRLAVQARRPQLALVLLDGELVADDEAVALVGRGRRPLDHYGARVEHVDVQVFGRAVRHVRLGLDEHARRSSSLCLCAVDGVAVCCCCLVGARDQLELVRRVLEQMVVEEELVEVVVSMLLLLAARRRRQLDVHVALLVGGRCLVVLAAAAAAAA